MSFDRKIDYNNGIKIPYDTNFRIAPASNVLMCIEGGSAGRKIAILNEDVCFGNKLACFQTYFDISQYLYNYLQSPSFTQIFKGEISGIIGGVSINTLKSLFLPLPPLNEQKRIVERIDEVDPHLDQYDKLEKELTKLENEITDKLKKSILQYAIEGKLVKQDPNDEPASVLLERIKAEKEKLIKEGKIKRDKNESFIYQGDDKNYYEKSHKNETPLPIQDCIYNIPSSWTWCAISELTKQITDGTHKTPTYKSNGIPFISIQNISSGSFNLSNIKYISNDEHNSLKQRCLPEKGDLLLCRIGTLGKPIINSLDFEFSIFVSVGLIKPVDYSFNKYLQLVLNSPNSTKFMDYIKVGGGTHTYKLNIEDINKFPIPLAPLSEQKRIIDKIEVLFNML